MPTPIEVFSEVKKIIGKECWRRFNQDPNVAIDIKPTPLKVRGLLPDEEWFPMQFTEEELMCDGAHACANRFLDAYEQERKATGRE